MKTISTITTAKKIGKNTAAVTVVLVIVDG
mgnify:CR=1 FL=1